MPIVFTPNRAEHYLAKMTNHEADLSRLFHDLAYPTAARLVYHCGPDPAHLPQWFVPKPYRATAAYAAQHQAMGFFEGWGTVAAQLENYA
jgi:uncharacterized protein YndB with AHSA1/START domain